MSDFLRDWINRNCNMKKIFDDMSQILIKYKTANIGFNARTLFTAHFILAKTTNINI